MVAKLASQRSNVFIAAFLRAKVHGLATHLFLDRCGSGNVGSTNRVFLEFTSQRNLVGWTRRDALRCRTGLHRFGESLEDDPNNAFQHGDQKYRENEIEDEPKHCPLLFYRKVAAILLWRLLCE